MKKSTGRWIWVLVVSVIVAAVAVPKIQQMRQQNKPKSGARNAAQALRVTGFIAQPTQVEDKIVVSGSLIADAQADVRCELNGKVVAILFQEGTPVTKDQVLLQIDDTELQAEKKRLEHEIVLAAETEARLARILEEGITSQDAYDRALKERNTLNARLEVVVAQIEKTVVKAPFDGLIGLKHISVGSYVSPTTSIARIHKIDPIKINFFVPEKYAGRVQPGKKIRFRRTGRNEMLTGKVFAIEPSIDTETRTLPIRAVAPNPNRNILPGEFVEVELVLDVIDNALMIPTEALIPSIAGQKVFVNAAGKAVQTPVETGLRSEKSIQITSGLNPGDVVITSGVLQLTDGMSVTLDEHPAAKEANP